MTERTAEQEVLDDLAGRADLEEAARSLAAGSVVRGRLSPEAAAQRSPYTAEQLRALLGGDATSSVDPSIEVSVVVPAYNEEENLDALWHRLRPVLDAVGGGEVVLVDDGSRDATWSEITRLAASDGRVRGLRLSRNFGHQAALSAGMADARGRTVCFLDADLQDPPELIQQLLEQWRAGNQVVYAVRRNRKEGLAKRLAYRSFYRLYRRLANM